MDKVGKYIIDYSGLENGHYTFEIGVDGSLFAEMEAVEIKDGDLVARVEMERSESMLDLRVAIEGDVVVECDRCLEDCKVPIDFEGGLLVRFSDSISDYDGEQMWIARGDELNLAQYIYESIVISLPYRRVHAEGECNPDMMARFTPASEEESCDAE